MKRVLILCNGNPPSQQLLRECRAKADYFIAADGGANVARQLGVVPDVVVGDLDSFEESDEDPFKVIPDPDQESNDLEKALDVAREEQATHVVVLGATGQRVDQTLKNVSVLKQYNHLFRDLRIKDNFGDLWLLESPFEKDLKPGTQVSLFPLSGKASGITTVGLKFPLNDESLENGVRDGSSNEVVKSPVQITYKTGDLMIYIARESH